MKRQCFACSRSSLTRSFVLVVWNRFHPQAAHLFQSTPASRSPPANSAWGKSSSPLRLISTGSSSTRRWASPVHLLYQVSADAHFVLSGINSWKNESTKINVTVALWRIDLIWRISVFYKSADGSGVHTRSGHSGRRERRKVSSARRKRFRWIHRTGKTQTQQV